MSQLREACAAVWHRHHTARPCEVEKQCSKQGLPGDPDSSCTGAAKGPGALDDPLCVVAV